MERLFPLHRSQTGAGNRQTFEIIGELISTEVIEVASETEVLGWKVPREWSVQQAYIAFRGERLIDYADSNLHILNGSQPIQGTFHFAELNEHLYVHDKLPAAIPYRTAFFRDQWGFCLTQAQRDLLQDLDGPFEVVIETAESTGSLSYAEINTHPTAESDILIWSHCCHPSLANDNLSGMAVAAFLAKEMKARGSQHNFRFVMAPATMGAICWLGQCSDPKSIKAALVLSLLGDSSRFHYKQSRDNRSLIDRTFKLLIEAGELDAEIIGFTPFGYDERQFNSPQTGMVAGRLTRALPGEFDEYHSSHDNLEFVSPDALEESFHAILRVLEVIDANETYINQAGGCEPCLQPYNLYQAYGETARSEIKHEAVMWVLNQSDGKHDLIDISQVSDLPFDEIHRAAQALEEVELLSKVPTGGRP